ncbi:FeoA domain-containing protein [Clostridium sp. 19966]|uniref:FeoA family protein n=1 Tax=Clostridium sp. 19966 TaxID=2768166 RepID=UPI0028E01955|nr:FeoA domain-containing protein [Clostridium sp. 19966]MDT8715184.1 FeoA domain-containing protein [Clostridium sp. 19966]
MSRGIPLNVIDTGRQATVDTVCGGENMCKKLMEMGVNKGAVIEMVKNDSGSIIIKLGESRLVLARGMAQKVLVQEL